VTAVAEAKRRPVIEPPRPTTRGTLIRRCQPSGEGGIDCCMLLSGNNTIDARDGEQTAPFVAPQLMPAPPPRARAGQVPLLGDVVAFPGGRLGERDNGTMRQPGTTAVVDEGGVWLRGTDALAPD